MKQQTRRVFSTGKMRESFAQIAARPERRLQPSGLVCLLVVLTMLWLSGPGVQLGYSKFYSCRGPGGSVSYTNAPTGPNCRPYQFKSPYRSWSKRLNFTGVGSFDNEIRTIARRNNVDPSLIKAIIHTESDFNPRAVSSKGALGLMQLMPATARELQVANPFNPRENIDGGTRYFRYLLDNFNNNLILSLAAYNAGPTLVKRTGGVPQIPETRRYINKVLRRYRHYRENW